MSFPDLSNHPLCAYFLSGYLSRRNDDLNFPPDQISGVLGKYEALFSSALLKLGKTKESLGRRSEFNFDSGDGANLESAIALLRTVELLHQKGFSKIALVDLESNVTGADIFCEQGSRRVCLEVKAITKQSSGRKGSFLLEQLYEKMRESTSKARKQLLATAEALNCSVKILVYVVNWFAQTIYLDQHDYQTIVNRLEDDEGENSLVGIDGVLFILALGSHLAS